MGVKALCGLKKKKRKSPDIAHPVHGHKAVTKSPIKQWLFNENSCKQRLTSKISSESNNNEDYKRTNGLEDAHSPLSETTVMLVTEATIASPDLQDCDVSSNASNLSSGALQNIREQMASSLEKMKYLEDQIKIIPILQEQLQAIKQEKEVISQQLNKELENAKKIMMTTQNENLQPFRTYHTLPLKPVFDKMSRGAQEDVKFTGKTTSPSTREMGVSCTVMTRDIGISHNKPRQCSVATSTELIAHQALKKNLPKMVTSAISTELKMHEIYSDLDLKIFEKSFREKFLSEKCNNMHNKYIQTSQESLRMIEKRDKEVQTDFKKLFISVGVTAKQKMCDAETQDKLLNTSNMKIKCNLCEHLSKEKVILSTSENDTNKSLSLRTMGMTKSKSFDYGDSSILCLPRNRSTRSVACGIVKSIMDSKSTDTKDLRLRLKDAGINTIKKHYVDVAVGSPINNSASKSVICDKCVSEVNTCAMSTPAKVSAVTSRIPRPTNSIHAYSSMHNPERNKLIKQDTNAKITAEIHQIQDNFLPIKNNTSNLSNLNLKNICASVSEDCDEDGPKDDIKAVGDHASISDSNFFKPIQINQRKTTEPSKEMLAAMKVLSDALQKSPTGSVPHLFKTAINIIQQEWFKISSVASANPLDVEDYLDCFEDFSSRLLEYIVNMADISGNTAMHYAVSHGNFDVVSILLDSKVCNINQPNAAGYTCVMLVSLAEVHSETHRQVVRRLFQLADVNMRATQHGQTALMLAVSHGRTDMVQLLLESGADVNIQDEDGSTALMCAAEHHHIDVVKLLLAHPDCDLSITDYDGSTALNIAMEAGHRDIGVLLYAQEHFSRGSSPYASLKSRRSKSVTPTLKSVHN